MKPITRETLQERDNFPFIAYVIGLIVGVLFGLNIGNLLNNFGW